MTVITNMPLYRAVVVRAGIGLYVKSGIIPNRAWTPTAMLKAASSITGKAYKRGQHQQAFIDLGHWLTVQQLAGQKLTDEIPQ